MGRPYRVEPLLANIREVTPEAQVVFAASDQPTIAELDRAGVEYITDDGDRFGPRINRLYQATSRPYVFIGADDVLFHPGWLDHTMTSMEEVDGVVAVNDLYNPCGTLGLFSRRYVEEEGGSADQKGVVVCPLYAHWYVETESWEVAKSRGRFRYCAEAIVEHLHPATGKANALPVDDTYIKGNSSSEEDLHLYLSRARLWSS